MTTADFPGYILEKTDRTPGLFYSERLIRENIAGIHSGLRPVLDGRYAIHFAVKSCYHLQLLKLMRALGVKAEVMTFLEWRLAKKAGFAGGDIVCNGLGHSAEFFEELVSAQAAVNIDNFEDFRKLSAAARRQKRRVETGLRLKVDLNAFDTPYRSMDNKLGLSPFSEEFNVVLSACSRDPFVRLNAVHVNISVNEKDAGIYVHALGHLAAVARRIYSLHGNIAISRVDIGGGFATGGLPGFQARSFFSRIATAFSLQFPEASLLLEPGRYLVNNAGFVAATVLAVKAVGRRNYIVTDATTNVLIPLETADYRLVSPAPWKGSKKDEAFDCSIVDGITSPHNVVIGSVRLKKLPSMGERIVLGNCGGYTSVLGEFWGYEPFPSTLVYADGKNKVMLSRNAIRAARRSLLGI